MKCGNKFYFIFFGQHFMLIKQSSKIPSVTKMFCVNV